MVGKRACSARITRDSTVPSPTPASNSRSAGGDGCRLDNSSEMRLAISVFSLQVDTNSRYFCRLSKKRKPGGGLWLNRRLVRRRAVLAEIGAELVKRGRGDPCAITQARHQLAVIDGE